MIQAIIFDLDGTLADTLADIAGAMNHVLAERGKPAQPAAAYKPWIGEGIARLVQRAAGTGEDTEGLVEAFRARYFAHLLDETVPYPGVVSLLDDLVERNLSLAVLSNKPHAPTTRIVEHLFPHTPFRAVLGHRPPRQRKPDPKVALELAKTLDVDPGRCAFVGDTPVDVETALGARMIPVAVTWGFREADALRRAGARLLIDRAEELVALL